jgi:dihydrofolate reductase
VKKQKNSVFIATSIDGYIADVNGGIDWLDTIPEINDIDSGYEAFTSQIDALVMGRVTYETVLGFDIDWPYKKPVFVLSNTITSISDELRGKVHIVKGSLNEILEQIHQQGYHRLYIDGGRLIQSFLKEDLIDEMVITIIPVLLGGGYSLFGEQSQMLTFKCIVSKHYLNSIVQNHFVRSRSE